MLVYPEYLDVLYAKPVVQTEEKIVEVQQVQTIERKVEVPEIQCQEVIRHVTVSQDQEVTMLPGTAFHRPISQTHANRFITKD